MYSTLLLFCLVLMASLFKDRCLRRGKVHINPIFGLLVGTSYYVLLPCSVIAYFGEGLGEITVYDSYLSLANASSVMAFTVALLAAVWLGTRLAAPKTGGRKGSGSLRRRSNPGIAADVGPYLMLGSFVLLLALAYSIRDSLFMGYDESVLENDAVWSARGAMSSFYSLIYVSICAILLRSRGTPPARLRRAMLFVFLAASIILLSLGARLYVAMALVSLLALLSLLRDGIPATRLLLYLLGGGVVFGAVGVLRSGSLTGLASVGLNIALEPLLTSISLFTLITDNPLILFGKPYMFPAEFQAVLPSFLFPGKAGLFQRLHEYGYVFESPVGGYHLYFSALINFGIVGSVFLAVPCGLALGRLSGGQRTMRMSTAVTSVVLTGALTFTIFRDPFFISVVKNVFVMAILVPKVITSFTAFGSKKARTGIRHACDAS